MLSKTNYVYGNEYIRWVVPYEASNKNCRRQLVYRDCQIGNLRPINNYYDAIQNYIQSKKE